MLKIIRLVLAPIVSLVILVMGNALFVTYTSVRLKLDGYNVQTIGYIIGAYFAGLLVGSLASNRIIEKVGHIRAYAAFAAFMTVLAMIQALFQQIWMWGVVRFFGGACLAGLFIIIESWLLAKSTPNTKGKVLSIYLIAFYASQGIGQFLLNVADPLSFTPFAIIVLLSAISIVPIATTKMAPPSIQQFSNLTLVQLLKNSPLGFFTCILSGLLLGPIYGLIPIFAKESGMTLDHVAYATSFTILGGFIFQWPIGQLSDKSDRKKVIALIAFGTSIIASVMCFIPYTSELLIFFLLALFGGFSFVIYPLGISHCSDTIEEKDLIAATAGLSLAYSIGAIVGPIVASFTMKLLGPRGLFIYSFCAGTLLFLIACSKIVQRKEQSQKKE
jgi:MFS family permease